jgi:GNAT superfamily N-acetyltransferase
MERLIDLRSPEELARHGGATDLPPFDPADLVRHAPDAHWLQVNGDGQIVGRCSLWWRRTPSLPDHRLGLIGHYAVRDAVAARRLLLHACEHLAARDCTLAVGPMDGSTWRRYRLIVERGVQPPFFLEPDNPNDWPGHFLDNGFTPLAHYTSTLNTDLGLTDPRVAAAAVRLAGQGFRIRTVDPDHLEDELGRIYAVALRSFAKNLLYTPISHEEFLAQYRPLLPHVRPELVFIAEIQGHPVGFLFGVPDLLQAQRGQAIDTAMIKSLAVVPECAGLGLGGLLSARYQEAARNLGYKRVIYALMHEGNNAQKISGHYAYPIRRYALFAKPLGRQRTESFPPPRRRDAEVTHEPESVR